MADTEIETGRRKLDWARQHMPIHARLREELGRGRPFEGLTLAVCSHLEAKTGVFIETLAAAGARVAFTASEPMTTQDDVVAALNAQSGLIGYAQRGVDEAGFAERHRACLAEGPQLILDDAAELTARLVNERPDLLSSLLGTCEQTTSGVLRLQAMHAQGAMGFPSYAVNHTPMKHQFDNVHGTGESTLSNLLQVTNLLMAGKRVVVAGYGFCGRGVAEKARGWGARVTVTEIDPRKALEAHMQGFEVAPMSEAVADADFVITTTGNRGVVRGEHFEAMADGAVLANAGHFNVEIDADALAAAAQTRVEVKPGVSEFRFADGRRLHLVAEGRLANLAAPTSMGHPAEVMDQTFAVQVAAAADLVANRAVRAAGVHPVPEAVDRRVATLKLASLGIELDELTTDQRDYLAAWRAEDIKGGAHE